MSDRLQRIPPHDDPPIPDDDDPASEAGQDATQAKPFTHDGSEPLNALAAIMQDEPNTRYVRLTPQRVAQLEALAFTPAELRRRVAAQVTQDNVS